MSTSTIRLPHLVVQGISVCVPSNRVSNQDLVLEGVDMARLIETTGIANRRIASSITTTADLCTRAAEVLLDDPALAGAREQIKVLVFVTQSPDYIVPSTAHILQHRLGLDQSCVAIQVNEGCSGYVYGIFLLSNLLRAFPGAKGLLLAGDTSSVSCNPQDKSTVPLFGDAGSATLLVHGEGEDSYLLGGDGKGYADIMIPNLGYREKIGPTSLLDRNEDGLIRNGMNLRLDGMNVFTFGITRVPKIILAHLEAESLSISDIDFVVLHQANRMMLEAIRKKIKATPEQVPYSLAEYGNTSSATIPLTLVANLRESLISESRKYLLCGFGVGLSWGSLITEISESPVAKLIDYEE